MVSLETTVAGIPLSCCVYNASGPRTGNVNALVKIGTSAAGAVLSKSATLRAQDGNPLPRYKELPLGDGCPGSINSEGLPNQGIDYYLEEDVIKLVNETGKPYIVSLSGLSLEDNLTMLQKALNTSGVAAIELNLACPNIPGKPVIAYDFDQMESVLQSVTSHKSFGAKPLGVKLAPYFDIPHFEKVAAILNKYPIKFVVCTNTVGNGLLVDAENEMAIIKPKNGFGGLGGGWIKNIALANVRQFWNLLREDIDIVGVGGVSTGTDAFELILCGAKAVQVGTKHWTEGAVCFDRISSELKDIMKRKGYKSISDFRGKLKPYSKPSVSKAAQAKSSSNVEKSGFMANLHMRLVMDFIVVFFAMFCAILVARERGLL
mmetsp:Transcript_13449/g.18404  ORF Transcript_13449/g.18404 Transcript_13449/m.18404 type:complete len:375 (-) Transcript_13449:139-1263(-)